MIATPAAISPFPRPIRNHNPDRGISLTFLLLSFWLFWMYARPEDLVTSLRHIPLAIGLLCLLGHLANSLGGESTFLKITPISVSLAMLTVWALIGFPFSFWVVGSINMFVFHWAKMLFLFLLVGHVISNIRQFRTAVWICVYSAAFVATVAMIIHFTLGPQGTSGRLQAIVSGPYAGSNYLSLAVLLMLPYCLFTFFVGRGLFTRLWGGVLCFIFTTANLLTQSRSGATAMVLLLLYAVYKLRKWGKSMLFISGVLFLAGLPLIAAFGKGLATRFAATASDYDITQAGTGSVYERTAASTHKRLLLLIRAASLTLDEPIMGVGLGNFTGAAAKTWSTGRASDWAAPHNTYLEFSAELGVPGLMMYLLMLYSIFRILWGVRRRITVEMLKDPKYYELALLCDATTVSLFGYCLTSIFASVAFNSYVYLLAAFAQTAYRLAQELPELAEEKKARRAPAMWPAVASPQTGVTE